MSISSSQRNRFFSFLCVAGGVIFPRTRDGEHRGSLAGRLPPEMIHPKTGRVYTSYHQAVAATGRLSSSDPNLQSIPVRTEEGRRIRQAFVS